MFAASGATSFDLLLVTAVVAWAAGAPGGAFGATAADGGADVAFGRSSLTSVLFHRRLVLVMAVAIDGNRTLVSAEAALREPDNDELGARQGCNNVRRAGAVAALCRHRTQLEARNCPG